MSTSKERAASKCKVSSQRIVLLCVKLQVGLSRGTSLSLREARNSEIFLVGV